MQRAEERTDDAGLRNREARHVKTNCICKFVYGQTSGRSRLSSAVCRAAGQVASKRPKLNLLAINAAY